MCQIILKSASRSRSYGPDKFGLTDAHKPNCLFNNYVLLTASGLENKMYCPRTCRKLTNSKECLLMPVCGDSQV